MEKFVQLGPVVIPVHRVSLVERVEPLTHIHTDDFRIITNASVKYVNWLINERDPYTVPPVDEQLDLLIEVSPKGRYYFKHPASEAYAKNEVAMDALHALADVLKPKA